MALTSKFRLCASTGDQNNEIRGGGTLTVIDIRQALQNTIALQWYSDGGFVPGVGGAAGVQLIAHTAVNGTLQRCMIGYLYEFHPAANSAFEMELRGLELALVKMMESICKIPP